MDRVPENLKQLSYGIRERRLSRMLDILDNRISNAVLIIEAVRRRHNVSAILRSADALGIHEVHLITGDFKPSTGAAKGSERWLNLIYHNNTKDCFEYLKQKGFNIFLADLNEKSFTPENVPINNPIAILFGTELQGVSQEAKNLADGTIQLPMYGFVESLNVSVAAAVISQVVTSRIRKINAISLSDQVKEETLKTWLSRELDYHSTTHKRNL